MIYVWIIYFYSADDINIAAIIGGVLIVVLVLLIISIVIRLAYKRGYFASKRTA